MVLITVLHCFVPYHDGTILQGFHLKFLAEGQLVFTDRQFCLTEHLYKSNFPPDGQTIFCALKRLS